MNLKHTFLIRATPEVVWKIITNYDQLSQWAGLTTDFIVSGKKVKSGTLFHETHLFLGRRLYQGKFLTWIENSQWSLESQPLDGTGIPLTHYVIYTIESKKNSTLVSSTATYHVNWRFGIFFDILLYLFAFFYVWNLHRKIKRGCIRKIT